MFLKKLSYVLFVLCFVFLGLGLWFMMNPQ